MAVAIAGGAPLTGQFNAVSGPGSTTIPTCDFLLVGFGLQGGGATVSSVTFNAVGLTEITGASLDAGVPGRPIASWWYLPSPPAAGSYDLVITLSAGRIVNWTVYPLTGVASASEVDGSNEAIGSTGNPSLSVTSQSGGMAFDCVAIYDATAPSNPTAGGGQTDDYNTTAGTTCRVAFSHESGAASVTMSWTVGGADDRWGHAACAIAPLSTGPAGEVVVTRFSDIQ